MNIYDENRHRPHSRSVFLISENKTYLYSDLNIYVHQLHDIFARHEICQHHKIALLAKTTDELVLTIAASWKLGIPFVPLSPNLNDHELSSYIERLQPELIFTDADNQNRLSYYQDRQMLFPAFNKAYINNNVRSGVSPDPESYFGYFFTSGTTGQPKIVPLKRRQMYHAAESSALNFRPDTNHFWLLCMPLNHIGGISVILRSLLYGSGIYRLSSFDKELVKNLLIEETSIQVVSFVPTMLKRLLSDPDFSVHKNFKTVLLGGAPASPKLLKEALRKNIPAIPSFGMTETCAQIAAVKLNKRFKIKSGLVGTIFQGNEVSIRNEQGLSLQPSEIGTIWLKGPQVFDGYFDDFDNTNRFDDDGWFDTHDSGWLDEKNRLYVFSRRSDLIISGGENISPYEVEQALQNVESIDEAAVTGLPDEEWGQIVTALVVFKDGYSISLEELRSALHNELPNFKKPRRLIKVESLPKTRSGKIRRDQLKVIADQS